jgi:hypothetical protein
MKGPQQLLLIRGDDRTLTGTATTGDLTTASSLRFTAKVATTDTDANAVLQYDLDNGITVNSASSLTIEISDADWPDKHYERLVWDLELRTAAGRVTTVAYGIATIRDDVTRDAP